MKQKLQAQKAKEAQDIQDSSLSEPSLSGDVFRVNHSADQTGPFSAPPAIKMSFLDQINAKVPSASPLSFLEQIKARNQQQ
jgi:hypothetical protein